MGPCTIHILFVCIEMLFWSFELCIAIVHLYFCFYLYIVIRSSLKERMEFPE